MPKRGSNIISLYRERERLRVILSRNLDNFKVGDNEHNAHAVGNISVVNIYLHGVGFAYYSTKAVQSRVMVISFVPTLFHLKLMFNLCFAGAEAHNAYWQKYVMKTWKKILLSLLIIPLMTGMKLHAEEMMKVYSLALWTSDKDHVDFAFDDKPVIMYDAGTYTARTLKTTAEFPEKELKRFTILEELIPVGVEEISTDKSLVDSDSAIRIYDTNGSLVGIYQQNVPVNKLHSGTYIIKSSKLTSKIIIK